MKILKSLETGFNRSARTWKGVLITWFVLLVMTALIALPLKGIMNAGLGQSAITQRLSKGLDLETLLDMGSAWTALTHSFTAGLFLLIMFVVLANAFLTGGLFDSLKNSGSRFSSSVFFGASAKNFFSFLVITLVIGVMLYLAAFLLVGLPLIGIISSGLGNEKTHWLMMKVFIALFVCISLFLLLVADYARAWQVRQEKRASFRAIGFGFSQSFGKCISSWPLMLIIWIIQTAFVFFVIRIIGRAKPSTGLAVFSFFLLSQVLFILRLFIKVWRYGSVTALMEINSESPVQHGSTLVEESTING